MSAPQQRRRPISIGDRIIHMDGRHGVVLELFHTALPCALVDLEPRDKRQPPTREKIPLGYLDRLGTGRGGLGDG